jgi:hypothetical protein
LAEDREGNRAALKVGKDPAERHRLADEAERLLLVDSPELVDVLDAGVVEAEVAPPAGPRIAAGSPYVALQWAEGRAIDVSAACEPARRLAIAWVVARDVGAALDDLHRAGSAHGDVKPANIVLEDRADGTFRARLVDLGLAAPADELLPRGGSRRYLAPELTASGDGDARARDLFALGLTLAEIADADVARSALPLAAAQRAVIDPKLAPLIRALLAEAPAVRPSAGWACRQAWLALGDRNVEGARRERARREVRRAYLAVRRRELFTAAEHEQTEIRLSGAPGDWLRHALRIARRLVLMRGRANRAVPAVLGPLDGLARARWLVALVGPAAARWPALSQLTEEELAERLLELSDRLDPESFTLANLANRTGDDARLSEDPVTLALSLGSGKTDAPVLDAAERLVVAGTAPAALILALGRALRLRGQLGRALSVLERLD